MAERKLLTGILVMTLAFFFAGCADVWTKVTDDNQLNGRWNGTYSITQSSSEYGGGFDLFGAGDMIVNIKTTIDMDVTINTNNISGTVKVLTAFSGKDVNAFWDNFSQIASLLGDVDNDKKTITMTETMTNEPLSGSGFIDAEINQNGKKIRVSIDDDINIILKKR